MLFDANLKGYPRIGAFTTHQVKFKMPNIVVDIDEVIELTAGNDIKWMMSIVSLCDFVMTWKLMGLTNYAKKVLEVIERENWCWTAKNAFLMTNLVLNFFFVEWKIY